MQCPKCQAGKVVKGKTRYGCSAYKSGCDFGIPFIFMGKKISDNQIKRLVDKGSTVKLKGFKTSSGKVDGKIIFNADKTLAFEGATTPNIQTKKPSSKSTQMPACPKCKKGKLIKGKTAYGCTLWKSGCDFRFGFAKIKKQAAGRKLSKALVLKIISG
jgi:DNA topoisomerase-3